MTNNRHHQKKKIYVVFKGRQPRIYSSWLDCQEQVNGFPGCLFKSYSSLEEAKTEWLRYWGMFYVGDVPPEGQQDDPPQEANSEEAVEVLVVEGGIVSRPPRSHMLTWVLLVTFFLTLALLIVSSVIAL
ncbi:Ribosomal protein L9/RNase H1, N-terminal [Sesbania bispinosa]|nr:Ribosomal protein L9/RNase H1, N-terminal [Sesbania bispinosa]